MVGELLQRSQFSLPPQKIPLTGTKRVWAAEHPKPERSGVESHLLAEAWRALREEGEEEVGEGAVIREREREAEAGRRGGGEESVAPCLWEASGWSQAAEDGEHMRERDPRGRSGENMLLSKVCGYL